MANDPVANDPMAEEKRSRRLSRRGFLLGSAAGAALVTSSHAGPAAAGDVPDQGTTALGKATVAAHGAHQAGVATPLQAHAVFVGLNLEPATTRQGLARLMRIWSNDAQRLTQGQPALADTEPELATVPARLTATVGFGPGVFSLKGLQGQQPSWLKPFPPFKIDRLQAKFSGGDLLLQLCSDDPITLAHAQRMMIKDAASFATVAWSQRGFHRAAAHSPAGVTGRNLMGQVDGTVNPVPETAEFNNAIWISQGPEWIRNGTGMVLRRILMDLTGWDTLSRGEKELALGRRLNNGAPLTGEHERDTPDLEAKHDNGLLVIPEFSHVRAAAGAESKARFLRRPYNYDDGYTPNGKTNLGMMFAAYAADLTAQVLPVQKRLAENDLMNTWTTPIGSAVFAIPPGFSEGGFIGETLLG